MSRVTLSIFCIFFLLFTQTAQACTVKLPRGSDAVVDPKKVNDKLMSQTILAYTNQARCAAGQKPLKYDKKLTTAADIHSAWMAKARKMTHTSNVSGQTDLAARLKKTRATFKVTAAENIGKLSRMAFPRGASFRIKDAAACKFTTKDGSPIPSQSYQSLAREIVGLWMASPSHKKNIMKPRVLRHGATVGFDAKGQHCGDYFVTQVFAG